MRGLQGRVGHQLRAASGDTRDEELLDLEPREQLAMQRVLLLKNLGAGVVCGVRVQACEVCSVLASEKSHPLAMVQRAI